MVYLECAQARVYAEMVQFVEPRNLCWARPLALVANWMEWDDRQIYDLREGSDLLCPAPLFREALDTDTLPILSALYSTQNVLEGRGKLHQFLRQLWQENPSEFQVTRGG
jgi:hypothetical protein